jgi:hypothetical protein
LTPPLALDHVVLVVSELPTAIRQFNQMGFTVTPGGVHAGGLTHNALVSFADGVYLELLATTNRLSQRLLVLLRRVGLLSLYTARDNAFSRRFKASIAAGYGLSDYCLRAADLDLELPALQRGGLIIEGPIPGGRIRPDGQQVSWRVAIPATVDLPFLIDDTTLRELRVPNAPPEGHKNQVIGVAGITLGVHSLEESIARYRLLTGADPDPISQLPLPGIQNIEFSLGATRLSLVQPGRASQAMRKAVGRRLARPLIIWLQTLAVEPSGLLGLSYLPGKGVTLSRGNPFA